MEEVPADWGDLPASGYDLQRAVYDSYIDVMELWQKRFGDKINFPFLKTLLMPKLYPTETALKTNRLSLFFSAKVADKADWLRQRPGKGKDELQRQTDRLSIRNFAKRLSAEKMIFLGEIHYVDEIQDHISELIVEIKRQNPSRRIVVFTEFIDLPSAASGPRHTLATYYRRIAETELAPLTLQDGAKVRYAPMSFWWLLKQQVEIYPPEDPTQQALFQKEMLQGEWVSVYTLGERNKIWARVIAHKMAQIRRQNPDALFVVYAGMGHTSWLAPYALPKFFASEQPVVAEVSVGRPSWNSILYPVWGGQDPFFTRTSLVQQLYFWTGQDARLLGKQTGFDYLWVLPKDGR